MLAANLEDGKPCPVCGSIHHPQKALSEEAIPTDKQIEEADAKYKRFEAEKSSAEKSEATAGERLKNAKDRLEKFSETLELKAAEEFFAKAETDNQALKKTRENLKKGEKCISENTTNLENARKKYETAAKAAANVRGVIDEKIKQIPEEYSAAPEKLGEDLNAAEILKRKLDDAWKKADENFHKKSNEKSGAESALKSARIERDEIAEKVSGKIKPDISALRAESENLKKEHELMIRGESDYSNRLNNLKRLTEKLKSLVSEIETAQKNSDMWTRLSNVARGIDGKQKISFLRYHLRSMFREIVNEANNRLEKMSDGRYKLLAKDAGKTRASTAGLNLEIYDYYADTVRPVETLSGGESFLASLSLALGLAATVKNTVGGIKLDTIFIDEGFGTLDSETLDTAMKALLELQKGGRLVGIISHVEELKQQIPTRLKITKTKTGSHADFEN